MSQYPDFFSNSYNKKLFKKTTGGSTGEPFAYYTTSELQSYLWAGIILSWEVAGYKLGEKVAFFAGSSLIKQGIKHKLFYKLLNADLLYASPLNDDVMQAYAKQIQKNKTTIIYGYAHAINALADYLLRHPQGGFPHLKAVVCTAELLTDVARQNMEKAFAVKVFNQYGCNEAGISAYECEHSNMHIINTRAAYEIDDNGSLISTDLSNKGFIMMKYDITDIIEFSDKKCDCNRGFPVISKMVGRLNDVVVDMENNVLHASFFGIVFSKDDFIKQFQIIFDNTSIEVNIHSNKDENYFSEKYLPLLRKHSKFENYILTMNSPFVDASNSKHKEVVDNRKIA